MDIELFDEDEVLDEVITELGQQFVQRNLESVRSDIRQAHLIITFEGLESYHVVYMDQANLSMSAQEPLREGFKSWVSRAFWRLQGYSLKQKIQNWNDKDRISHAVFKAVSKVLDTDS